MRAARVPAVADDPVGALGAELAPPLVPGAGREGHVADGAGDARHGGGAVHDRSGQPGPGTTSRPSASSPRPWSRSGRRGRSRRRQRSGRRRAGPARRRGAGQWRRRARRRGKIATKAPVSEAGRARRVSSEMRACQAPSSVRRSATCSAVGARARRRAAVGHEHDAIRPRGGGRVMGDHDERPAASRRSARAAARGRPGRAGVERAGGLVGEDHARAADQGAGDGDALLLAAGELRRAVAAAIVETHAGEGPRGPRSGPGGGPASCGSGDVLLGGQRAEQVERLEDEADALAAQPGERALAEPAQRLTGEPDARPASAGRARRRAAGGWTCRSRTGP